MQSLNINQGSLVRDACMHFEYLHPQRVVRECKSEFAILTFHLLHIDSTYIQVFPRAIVLATKPRFHIKKTYCVNVGLVVRMINKRKP